MDGSELFLFFKFLQVKKKRRKELVKESEEEGKKE